MVDINNRFADRYFGPEDSDSKTRIDLLEKQVQALYQMVEGLGLFATREIKARQQITRDTLDMFETTLEYMQAHQEDHNASASSY